MGRHYIMMEYVDGGSLRDKFAGKTPQLPIDENSQYRARFYQMRWAPRSSLEYHSPWTLSPAKCPHR